MKKIKKFLKDNEEDIFIVGATALITGFGLKYMYDAGHKVGRHNMRLIAGDIVKSTDTDKKKLILTSLDGTTTILEFLDNE